MQSELRPIVEGHDERIIGGRYQLMGRLKSTLNADHWIALDMASNDLVRVVQLRTLNRDIVESFSRNAHALVHRGIPHAAIVLDTGIETTSTPLPYYVTDLVRGPRLVQSSLGRNAADPGQPIRDLIRRFAPLFRALDRIHAAGATLGRFHADDLMYDSSGEPVISDLALDRPESADNPQGRDIARLGGILREAIEGLESAGSDRALDWLTRVLEEKSRLGTAGEAARYLESWLAIAEGNVPAIQATGG